MESIQTLIDFASKIHGSRYRVAQLIGESESNLGSMARNERPTPPKIAAKLAALSGVDPREAALVAIADREVDPEKRRELEALFRLPPEGMLWLDLKQAVGSWRKR